MQWDKSGSKGIPKTDKRRFYSTENLWRKTLQIGNRDGKNMTNTKSIGNIKERVKKKKRTQMATALTIK